MTHVSRRGRAVRVALAVIGMLAVALVALPDAHADDAEDALERASTATVREDFSGIVQIEWLSNGSWQVARVPVNGAGGTIQVGEGKRKVDVRGNDRWISSVDGWRVGWAQPVAADPPSPAKHWKLALAKGPEVAGRSTNVVTATDPKTRTARLKVYVDRDTGVMLRREVLDPRGKTVRSVGFVEVKKLGGTRSQPPAKPKTENKAGEKVAAPVKLVDVPKGYVAPPKIGSRYVLVGRYLRDDGTVQLYYSDGLFGISLFEQRGSLDWNGLPRGGGGVRVGDEQGRNYAVAGGTVLVWEHNDLTLTAISDITQGDLQTFAVAFGRQSGGDDDSAIDDIADFVLGPFGFR
jgi:sigma-E factor negative regulatory protein RseB